MEGLVSVILDIKQRFPIILMASSIVVTLFFYIWLMWPTWLINSSSLMLLKQNTENSPDQSPLFAIGIRPPRNTQRLNLPLMEKNESSVDFFNIHRYFTELNESSPSIVPIGDYDRIITLLENIQTLEFNNQGVLMKQARLALLAGHYQKSLDYLRDLEKESVCIQQDIDAFNCHPLRLSIGDALDGLEEPALALEYYRKINWVGRREAAAFLALTLGQEADRNGNPQQAKQWNKLAAEILPGTLATAYANDSEKITLRSEDNPHLLLKLGTDLRLERLNAEASVRLLQDGTWDQDTFHHVLAIRSWLVDLHTFDYHEYKIIWNWTPHIPNVPVQIAGLLAYFERIVELIPEEGIVWYYLAETKARLGSCEEALLYYEQAQEVRNPISPAYFTWFSPCQERISVDSTVFDLDDINFMANMENWRSYGQVFRLAAATSHHYGYERHAAWVWGPDKRYPAEGNAAFRADCLWYETSSDPTFLTLALTEPNGNVRLQELPAYHSLEMHYWWKASQDTQLTPQWFEKSGSMNGLVELHRTDILNQANGWYSTTLNILPNDKDRVFEFRWYMTDCGQIWLDHITYQIVKQ